MESLALSVIIVTTIVGTMLSLRRTGRGFRTPKASFAVAAATLVVSVLGNLNPDVLELLGRNRSLLLAGEWWRLVTPLLVQDGGWPGTIFNISSLIVVGLCAESLHRRSTYLIVYVLAGLISEVFAYTLLPDQGFAGNSVANMGAAALCLVTLCVAGAGSARIIGLIGVLTGVFLIVTGNLHGVGFAVGALSGAVILSMHSRRSRLSTKAQPGS